MKSSGFSNISIIIIPAFVVFLLGIIFVTAISPVTSTLVKKYETIKGSYGDDQNYLAAITTNGIWIKEKQKDITNIIRSSHLNNNKLINVSIYQFDSKNNFLLRIESESANITSNLWELNSVKTYKTSEENSAETKSLNHMVFKSIYDIDKIKNLYSNIDTVSFWDLKSEIEVLQNRGYSTKKMRGKFQESISFPFLLVSMTLLAGVFTLGIRFKGNNWTYVYFSILTCVVIYFFSDFSAALGETEKLPIAISVWMPVSIVFIFSTVGLIHVNRK